MDYRESIQAGIDYIEANLKTELTVQELADKAGFSLFHYCRLFQLAVGMPVMQYIVRRKLINAIYEISCGCRIINTALDYGFDTHAGFYKAFRREFGYAPSVFLKRHKMKKPYRLNLFQEEHIMMTHKRISDILKHWNLEHEPVADIYYESSGNKNDNAYYVGDQYVIKFTANLGALNKHIVLSKALENVGLSAAVPIKTTDGREYVDDSGIYCCLTQRLSGWQINVGDAYKGDYEAKAEFLGEIIGRLHAALKNVDAAVNDVNLYENTINWAIPKAKQIMSLPEPFCRDYVNSFGRLYNKLPKQIIHRDLNPGNIILNNDHWGFLDFELSERNIRIFDPCYAATAILSESFGENDRSKLKKWIGFYMSVIRGYDRVAVLSEDERQAIPYVILSNQLGCVAWFSEQEKFKDIYEINKKMTSWLITSFDELRIIRI